MGSLSFPLAGEGKEKFLDNWNYPSLPLLRSRRRRRRRRRSKEGKTLTEEPLSSFPLTERDDGWAVGRAEKGEIPRLALPLGTRGNFFYSFLWEGKVWGPFSVFFLLLYTFCSMVYSTCRAQREKGIAPDVQQLATWTIARFLVTLRFRSFPTDHTIRSGL